MDRREWVLRVTGSLLGSFAATGAAFAQSPGAAPTAAAERQLVLMSLIGDELTMVLERNSVGSNLNQNNRSKMPLQPGVLDTSIVRLMQNAVKQQLPKARTTLVAPTEASLYQGQDEWFGSVTARLPGDVMKDLRATGARQLLLLSKHRADASLPTADGRVGTGQLEGLGYYLNTLTEVRDVDTNLVRPGFLAPYAYLRLSLVDLESAQVLGQQRLLGGYVVMDKRPDGDLNPWNAVPDNRKLQVLLDLVQREIDRAVPALLAKV